MVPRGFLSNLILMAMLLQCHVIQHTEAHTRLECPPPRTKATGAKKGPCDAADDLTLNPFPLQPGLNTITWLESLGHPGAPARFALSLDGTDTGFESCVLLDHVPHDERSKPKMQDELTHHRSSITLWIPDIQCERCTLQLITYMTDGMHGVAKGDMCVSPQASVEGTADSTLQDCGVIYHSCAPVSINGSTPRADHTCDLVEHNTQLGWPFMEGKPPMSTYLYRGDPGLYSEHNSRLVSAGTISAGCREGFYCDPDEHYQETFDVPTDAKYASFHGTCAAVVGMEVVPFVLGEIPSTPKGAGIDGRTDGADGAAGTVDDSSGSPAVTLAPSGDQMAGSGQRGLSASKVVVMTGTAAAALFTAIL